MVLINGTNADDQLFGSSGADQINGLAGNDLLFGDAGDDFLDGGLGIDIMRGGSGNDIYIVDNAQDQFIEDPNAGIDLVRSTSLITTLSANVENLELLSGASVGQGNELNNIINSSVGSRLLGGGGNDILNGSQFNDQLFGEVGNDTLNGGAGNDELNALLNDRTGQDILNGGLGDDTYIINANSIVNEDANAGIDTVRAISSYTLTANVENLTFSGISDSVIGTGNDLNNTIAGGNGNDTLRGGAGDDTLGERGNVIQNINLGLVELGDFGNDVLDGGIGNDTMFGGIGNDTYIVDSVGDRVIELVDAVPDPETGFIFQGGIDTVQSSISFTLGNLLENLTLTGTAAINGTGNSLNNTLTGNNSANVLDGQAGNDILLGRRGADVLRGGAGNDSLTGASGSDVLTGGEGTDAFVFDLGTAYNQAAMGADVVKDFVVGLDKIVLDKTTFGNIAKSDFGIVANDLAASTNAKLIVYSEATGKLFFNQNGSSSGFGQGGLFATLQGAPSIGASDIQIQA